MSKKSEIEHNNCGTPACCGECEDAMNEDAPANSVGDGGYTSAAPAAGPVAGVDLPLFKDFIKFKNKYYGVLRRRRP
jgi:hypothetical protein